MRREQLLRTQLLRWLLGPLVVLLAPDAAVSTLLAHRVAQQAQDKALIEIAHDLARMVQRGPGGEIWVDLPESARRIMFEDPQDRLAFEIQDAAGRRVAGEAIAPPDAKATRARTGAVLYDTKWQQEPVRAVQLELGSPTPGRLRVVETRHQRDAIAREILTVVVAPQVLLIALAALIVRVGIGRGLRPLEDLQRDVAQRSHRDLSPIDDQGVPGEVKPLVLSINSLLARLNEVLTLQSRFIADAAHQLKTPVAALKTHAELLCRDADPSQREELVGRITVGTERLSRLVSQLLALARNEPEAAKMIDFHPVDLGSLALDITAAWVPQALRQGIDLGLEGAEQTVMVRGDAGRLRELFDNLLDNAIRYSRAHGRVTVTVSAAPAPTVSVSDDGPRIAAQDQQRVFERFHRGLGSGEGSGLGLAIAQEIARRHGASIVVQEDADGVGNRFSVVFPPP